MSIAKAHCILLAVLLIGAANAIAQKSPLVITGAVTEVKPDGPYIEPFEHKNFRPLRKETYFSVRISLQYRNTGDVPLIVPTTTAFSYGTKRILFLDIPASDSKVAEFVDEWMYPRTHDPIPYLLKKLESAEPPEYFFVVIEPGGTYVTGDTIRAKSGYKLEIRPTNDKFPHDVEFAIPEHLSFKVQYRLALKDRPESTEPLADAQRRWSRFGKLLLNSSGDFFFETDVIINKLPE